jgi:protein-tyrosine phosphatase
MRDGNNRLKNRKNTNINDLTTAMPGIIDERQTLNLDKLIEKISYQFDYEVNNIKLDNNDDMNSKMYYYSPEKKSYRILNYNSFNDRLLPVFKIIPNKNKKKSEFNFSKYDKEFIEIDEPKLPKNVKTANILKRLVSKQKRRLQDEKFDLDMSYITRRVIAMGFPSIGCETIYRNSLKDVIDFFHTKHNDKVKIYNLCLEKDRIYNKNLFSNSSVGLFPATDHNPCPIKLILEFCIDICLYLLKNPNSVAAVHCKAGKGRTGVMICSYLVFSHLCESSEKAFRYYARIRTKNNTGVTIPSQKRYIKYFETFLQANFCPPYIFLIPKIIKSHFSHLMVGQGRLLVKNILQSFEKEKSYFISANKFRLKGVKVGPLPKGKKIKIKICNFINNNFKIKEDELVEYVHCNDSYNGSTDYELLFTPELTIHSDIKITFQGVVNYYIWVNLWYSSWENIKNFYDNAELNENEEKKLSSEDMEETRAPQMIKNEKILDKNLIRKINSLNNFNEKNNEKNLINMSTNRSYIKMNGDFSEDKKNDYNQNKMIDIFSNKEKITASKSLYEIIYKLKHNTDLNELINRINMDLENKFDKKNLEIVLNSFEFDKYKEINKYPDVKTTIYYSLLDKHY